MNISPEQYFYFSDGTSLKCIEDLKTELENNVNNIKINRFYNHVNQERNDYANWLRGVFKEYDLAEKISQQKSPEEILKVITEALSLKKEVSLKQDLTETPKLIKKDKFKSYIKSIFKKENKTKILNVEEVNNNQKNQLNENQKENIVEQDIVEDEQNSDEVNVDKEKVFEEFSKDPDDYDESENQKVAVQDDKKEELQVENNVESNEDNIILNELDTKNEDENKRNSFSDKSESLLEKINLMKSNSYLNLEKQRDSVSDLSERYEELYSLISENRKLGIDMLIPQLNLRLIKPKIHFLEVSNTKEERLKIVKLLDEVQEEIDEAIKTKEPDLKKEILEKAGLYTKKIEE